MPMETTSKVAQGLLPLGSAKMTLNEFAQALMPAKRKVQQKVVEIVRPEARQEAFAKANYIVPKLVAIISSATFERPVHTVVFSRR